ncbi:MAG: AraC family transcriptional regulator [Opitutaceae bacterium]
MIPFLDPVEWQENYGRFLLNARTGGYCSFDQNPTNGLHSHDFHEVCLITAGRGNYRCEGVDYPLQPGDVILALPNAKHEISSMQTRDLQLVFFAFVIHSGHTGSFSGERERLISSIRNSTRVHAGGHRRLLGYLQIFSRDLEMNWVVTRALGSFLTELLSSFSPSRPENEGTLEKASVARAVDYIDVNIRNPIQVAEIAGAIGISERSLRRYFSRLLEKTVIEVIRERKLNRASALLLMNFDIGSVGKIIHMEPSHFSRTFKKQFGVSPREFQKAHRRQTPPKSPVVRCLPRD